jgi:voltage-gated potassium channel
VLTHPIDVLAVLLPAFRPLKVLSVIGNDTFRGGGRGLLRTGQAVAVAAGLLVWVCAVAVLPFERGAPDATVDNLGDAFWWAFVTVTGVGYGDVTPVTAGGRIVGVLLMFVGLSLIGIITATVAAWFISSTSGVADEQEFNRDTEAKARLIILERKLDQLLAAQGEPTSMPPRSASKADG